MAISSALSTLLIVGTLGFSSQRSRLPTGAWQCVETSDADPKYCAKHRRVFEADGTGRACRGGAWRWRVEGVDDDGALLIIEHPDERADRLESYTMEFTDEGEMRLQGGVEHPQGAVWTSSWKKVDGCGSET